MRPGRPATLGLRARSCIAFGVLSLLLSSVLAVFTYNRCRVYLLNQRESVAVAQAAFNAELLSNALLAGGDDPARLITSVINVSGSQPMLLRNARWYVTSANIVPDDLPAELRRHSAAGVATRQRFTLRGQPQLAVAVPLTTGARLPTVYVATTSLMELQRTLKILAATLAAGAGGAAVVGAILGLYASRRVLRPLATIADTAEAIASGDLRARLHGLHDRDLSRLVATFNQMTDSLEERIQSERRFASHVSHELRSPLTSLRAAMTLIQGRSGELPERAQFGMDVLEHQVLQFERMVLDLLELATIESGSPSLDLSTFSVHQLVQTAIRHVGFAEVPIETDDVTAVALVEVDARRFERVVDNLLGNAARHGNGACAVRLERKADTAEVLMHVDDAGPGVPVADRSQVFDRFSRGSQARHLSGAGLGLALVREHVRLMRGGIDVGESPEGGARFTVRLPEVTR